MQIFEGICLPQNQEQYKNKEITWLLSVWFFQKDVCVKSKVL